MYMDSKIHMKWKMAGKKEEKQKDKHKKMTPLTCHILH